MANFVLRGYFCHPYSRVSATFENQILQGRMAGQFLVYEPKIAAGRVRHSPSRIG
jgi:hypothetical protein